MTTRKVAISGMIAALYVVLTLVATAFGLSSGTIQFRISEVLCILPIFTPAAIPGLAVGCLLSNILSRCVIWDTIFGTIATLVGAFGTYALRKHRWIAPLCPVLSNMIIIPFVLEYAYGVKQAYWFLVLTVGIGEFVCAYILGETLCSILKARKITIQ